MFFRHSPPNLIVCLFISLVSDRHDVPGLLRPIPRLAGREAQQRIAKRAAAAADADLRDAARVLVEVRAGDADVLARRQAVARRDGRVAVVVEAAADVEHRRLAEHARPRRRPCCRLLFVPVPAKPPLAGPPY